MGGDGDSEHAHDGEPGHEHGEAVGEPRDERVAAREARELRVGPPDRRELLLLAAVDDELGGAAQELDELGGQLAARRSLAAPGRGAEPGRERRQREPGDEEPGREDRAGNREDDRSGDDAHGRHDDRDERRPDPAEVEPLQRIDVADHAADEVAPAEVGEPRRRERLDARVEATADPPERAQGEIVGGEPVQVPRDRPRDPEEANEHDRDRQREHGRMLGRARDQVAGGRDQADAEADRKRAERDRERNAPGGHAGEPEQAAQGRHAGADLGADDPAALEPHDAVGSRGKLGTVRDQEHGAPGAQPLDRLADELGVDRVEVRGRLVEDHEGRVAQERARERDPLPLAGRQAPPALADDRAVPVRQPADERVGAGLLGGGPHAVVGRRGVAEPDVVGDRAAKQCWILRHPGDVRAPRRRVARGEVDPADRHAPVGRLAEAEQERGGGALAAAALADERDRLARLELEVDGLEHGDLPGRIGEGDAFEPDRRAARARRMPGPGRDRRRLLDQAEQPLGDGEPVGARVVGGGEIPQRQVELRARAGAP